MSVVHLATIEPITLTEAKAWLNVDYDDQDAVITSIIKAARLKIEKRCGISIALKQYRMKIAEFGEKIDLSNPPVISVESVKYLDEDGVEQTIDASAYTFIDDEYSPYLYPLEDWPTDVAARPDAVRVEFTSGIDIEDSPPDEVPADLLQAMRWLIGHLFENRESTVLTPTRQELQETPDTVAAIIAPYIVPRL